MRMILALITLSILTACGADGDPLPPTKTVTPGVTISGEARIGVAGSL